jgi:hypothetical protein
MIVLVVGFVVRVATDARSPTGLMPEAGTLVVGIRHSQAGTLLETD